MRGVSKLVITDRSRSFMHHFDVNIYNKVELFKKIVRVVVGSFVVVGSIQCVKLSTKVFCGHTI